jgi:hypothetical protein
MPPLLEAPRLALCAMGNRASAWPPCASYSTGAAYHKADTAIQKLVDLAAA